MYNYNQIKEEIKKFEEKSTEFKNSVDRKGEYKYILLFHFIFNVLEEIEIDEIIILEIYKYFIRLRRFIFKWVNFIEDYMTSIYIDNINISEINNKGKNDIKLILTKSSFGKKEEEIFSAKKYFQLFLKHTKLKNKFEDFYDYKYKLSKLINLRNWISHIDLFYINFDSLKVFKKKIYKKSKFVSIKLELDNLNCFIFGNDENEYKTFIEQIKEIEEKTILKDNYKERYMKLVKKIINFNFIKNEKEILIYS